MEIPDLDSIFFYQISHFKGEIIKVLPSKQTSMALFKKNFKNYIDEGFYERQDNKLCFLRDFTLYCSKLKIIRENGTKYLHELID